MSGITVCCDRGQVRLDGVDLAIAPGEVLGVAGVAGNGQRELAEVLLRAASAPGGLG